MTDSKSQRHCVDGRSHRNDQRGISSWLIKRRNRVYIRVRNRPASGVENFFPLERPARTEGPAPHDSSPGFPFISSEHHVHTLASHHHLSCLIDTSRMPAYIVIYISCFSFRYKAGKKFQTASFHISNGLGGLSIAYKYAF